MQTQNQFRDQINQQKEGLLHQGKKNSTSDAQKQSDILQKILPPTDGDRSVPTFGKVKEQIGEVGGVEKGTSLFAALLNEKLLDPDYQTFKKTNKTHESLTPETFAKFRKTFNGKAKDLLKNLKGYSSDELKNELGAMDQAILKNEEKMDPWGLSYSSEHDKRLADLRVTTSLVCDLLDMNENYWKLDKPEQKKFWMKWFQFCEACVSSKIPKIVDVTPRSARGIALEFFKWWFEKDFNQVLGKLQMTWDEVKKAWLDGLDLSDEIKKVEDPTEHLTKWLNGNFPMLEKYVKNGLPLLLKRIQEERKKALCDDQVQIEKEIEKKKQAKGKSAQAEHKAPDQRIKELKQEIRSIKLTANEKIQRLKQEIEKIQKDEQLQLKKVKEIPVPTHRTRCKSPNLERSKGPLNLPLRRGSIEKNHISDHSFANRKNEATNQVPPVLHQPAMRPGFGGPMGAMPVPLGGGIINTQNHMVPYNNANSPSQDSKIRGQNKVMKPKSNNCTHY